MRQVWQSQLEPSLPLLEEHMEALKTRESRWVRTCVSTDQRLKHAILGVQGSHDDRDSRHPLKQIN